MHINESDYPCLSTERTWSRGVTTLFEQAIPPDALVGNVSMAPFDDSGWLIVRQASGWGIVSGTLEPGETYLDALRRELLEEAGCELVSYRLLGALRTTSSAPAPYRAHIPHPVSYRLLCVGEVRRMGAPTNPEGGEFILEVRTQSLDETCKLLEMRPGPEDGPLTAEIYKLAASWSKHPRAVAQ
jgi:8-oxo-dGTP diphosphatase